MKSIYRAVTAPTFLYSLLLFGLGAVMYGDTYLQMAKERWFQYRLEYPDSYLSPSYAIQHEDRFTWEDGNEYRIYVLTDFTEGQGAVHRDRFVVADDDLRIHSITEHHHVPPYLRAGRVPTKLHAILEVVRLRPDSDLTQILRYELAPSGVQVITSGPFQRLENGEDQHIVRVWSGQPASEGRRYSGDRAKAGATVLGSRL